MSDLFSRCTFRGEESDLEIELRGLLLTYRSILAIQEKEDIKQKHRYDEITMREFTQRNQEIKTVFNDIYRFVGVPLLQKIKNMGVEHLAPGARQNTISGLYQLVDVCTRLNKYKQAIDICDFVISTFPGYFTSQFEMKLGWLRSKQKLVASYKRD